MKKKASRRLVAAFTLAAMLVTLMPSGAAFAAPAEEAGEATKVETTQQRASSPVEYTIKRYDDSLMENGSVKLKQYYDLVQVSGNSDAARKMNEAIKADLNKYVQEVMGCLDLAQKLPPVQDNFYYKNTHDAEVTKNSGGQFSVKVSWDWFMGNLVDNGYVGFNFDSSTGEPLSLTDVFQMSEMETEKYIKSCIIEYINTHSDYPWSPSVYSIIQWYPLKDFKFFLEDNKVVIYFDEGELGSGALGAVAIPCEMPVELMLTVYPKIVEENKDFAVSAYVKRGERPVRKGFLAAYLCDEINGTEKLLGRVDCNRGDTFMIQDIVVSASEGWTIGAKNKLIVRYFDETECCRAEQTDYIEGITTKVAQNQPPAPTKLEATDDYILLQDIEDSNQGEPVWYGIENGDGNIKWQREPLFYPLEPDTSYTFYAQYHPTNYYLESPISAGTTIRTEKAKKIPQAKPDQPYIAYIDTNEVRLETVRNSYNTPVQYGIYENGEVKWQDQPLFKNLQSDFDYEFCVKYLGDDQYLESEPSFPVTARTKRKYFDAPKIISDAADVRILADQSSPRESVDIVIVPCHGYEIDRVVLKDSAGKNIAVTKKSDERYTFEQTEEGAASLEVYCRSIEENEWHNPFYDVYSGAWYYDAVRYVYENGLIAGVASDCFAPDMDTSRGQLVTMLWRMAGEPNYGTNSGFDDVSSSAYYARAVAWASSENIVAGFPDGSFRPNEYITREQMAAFFMKYAAATGAGTYQREDLSQYSDINPNSWSYDALSWAKAVGLLSGVSDTTMAPQATATRAQIAAVLQRYCETVAK